MKKTILAFAILLFSNLTFAQEIIHRDSVVQDISQHLLKSKIIELDSITQKEIKERVKNWAGKTFVNMNEVLVSETESQLVFNYIEKYQVNAYGKTFIEGGEYTRLVIQIKDGKIKVSFFDSGNRADRSIYITDCFLNSESIENSGIKKSTYSAMKNYSGAYKNTLASLEKSITEKELVAMEDNF
jgi:hypothetical protein